MGYVWVDDHVGNTEILGEDYVGNTEILGESLRGLQSLMGAAPARRPAPGNALARLGQQRAQAALARYQPAQHTLQSPYKDSTQFGIVAQGTFLASAWDSGNTSLPTVSGRTRVYQSFKPQKAIADEQLLITFRNASLGDTTIAADVADAGDLLLITVFAGNKNCFPTAPDQSTGISGRSLSAQSLGNGVSWPTINGGIDMSVTWGVRKTAAYRAAPPAGYTSADIYSVEVITTLNLFGEQLR